MYQEPYEEDEAAFTIEFPKAGCINKVRTYRSLISPVTEERIGEN